VFVVKAKAQSIFIMICYKAQGILSAIKFSNGENNTANSGIVYTLASSDRLKIDPSLAHLKI
jgi:hypothetical protein